MAERSPEQRAADTRLAWIIVGLCGLLMLALATVLMRFARDYVIREAEAAWQRQIADARAREEAARDAPWHRVHGEVPTDVAASPPPPNTTHPLGNPTAWVGPNDYPAYALHNGDEGRVRVTVSAGADGRPLGCAVAESSGHWSLDNATCAAMLNHGRFAPAPAGFAGRTHWTSPPVRWVLPS